MEEIRLNKFQILEGKYLYPEDLIELIPTKHFWDRLIEREEGVLLIPTKVRVTPENIHSGKSRDGKTLHSVVIRLEYNKFRLIYMCFNPYDGGLKTVWFADKKKYRNHDTNVQTTMHQANSEQTVSDVRSESNPGNSS